MSARTYAGVYAVALEKFTDLDAEKAETLADAVAKLTLMREQDPERYRMIVESILDATGGPIMTPMGQKARTLVVDALQNAMTGIELLLDALRLLDGAEQYARDQQAHDTV